MRPTPTETLHLAKQKIPTALPQRGFDAFNLSHRFFKPARESEVVALAE